MEGYMTIGELSDILGIEKSTLRYWDQSGLIHLKRNSENNYREYSKNTVIEISDIAFYRSINMPIKKLKTINTMTSGEIDATLAEVEDTITREIEELVAKEDRYSGEEIISRNIMIYLRTHIKWKNRIWSMWYNLIIITKGFGASAYTIHIVTEFITIIKRVP